MSTMPLPMAQGLPSVAEVMEVDKDQAAQQQQQQQQDHQALPPVPPPTTSTNDAQDNIQTVDNSSKPNNAEGDDANKDSAQNNAEEESGPPIFLAHKDGSTALLKEMATMYRNGRHCDLELQCRDGVRLWCHKLIMAAVSPMIRAFSYSYLDSDQSVVMLPDLDSVAVTSFIDAVYCCMENGVVPTEQERSPEFVGVMDALSMSFPTPEELRSYASGVEMRREEKPERIKVKVEPDNYYDDSYDYGYDNNYDNNYGNDENNDDYDYQAKEENTKESDEDYDEEEEEEDEDDEDNDWDWREAVGATTRKRKRKERTPRVKKEPKVEGRRPGRPPKLDSEKKQRKPRQPRQPRGIEPLATTDEVERELSEIESALRKIDDSGSVVIKLNGRPFDTRNDMPQKTKVHFGVFMGLKVDPKHRFIGKPLAWSPPPSGMMESDRSRQFDNFCEGIKAVFGLSDVETYHHIIIKDKMKMRKARTKIHVPDLKREMAKYSEDRLRSILQKEEIVRAHATTPPRQSMQTIVSPEGEALTLPLSDSLQFGELDGVALFTYGKGGCLEGSYLDLGANKEDDVSTFLSALFDVWMLRTREKYIDKCDRIFQAYCEVQPSAVMYSMAKDFLENDNVKQETMASDEKQACSVCGMVFPLTRVIDRDRFRRHKEGHFIEEFKCDCPVTWDTISGKKHHVQLMHMTGYQKCEFCQLVGKQDGIEKHKMRNHYPATCEYCAATLKGTDRLQFHLVAFHPEHVPEEIRAKVRSRSGTCQYCGDHFDDLPKHIKHQHSEGKNLPCPECGKIFGRLFRLNMHVKRMHRPESERPYACQVCNRRYLLFCLIYFFWSYLNFLLMISL